MKAHFGGWGIVDFTFVVPSERPICSVTTALSHLTLLVNLIPDVYRRTDGVRSRFPKDLRSVKLSSSPSSLSPV